MTQLRKSTVAVAAGLAALTLLAAPGFAAPGGSTVGTAAPTVQLAHMGQGQGGGQWTGQPCPMDMTDPGTMAPDMGGQNMMAPQGMMRPDMDTQGRMGPGFGKGPGLGSQVVPSKDLTADDVHHFLDHRLEMHGNKRLKVGEIKEADEDTIVADITTGDGSLVQRLEVDRHTGKMRHVE